MSGEELSPRAAARRERILSAARTVLRRQGVEVTTVDDILAEGGIGRATFYRAFGSLEELVESLHAEFAERVIQRLVEALPDEGREGWLRDVIAAVLDDARERGTMLRVLFREELRPGAEAERTQRRRVAAQVEVIGAWWERTTGHAFDAPLVLCFTLLLQALGLHVARPDVDRAEVDRLIDAAEFVIEATRRRYIAEQV